jgi:hypothetical protein
VLKIYDVCNQKSAISFVDEVISRCRCSIHGSAIGASRCSSIAWATR